MRNTQRHEATSTSHPPSSGPIAVATPPRPDQAPMARARSSVANDACRIARLPGVSSAAPTPCTARAAMRVSTFGAIPHSSEASANQATPTTKTRRRPNRSPSVPLIRMNDARVRA